jgi:hypothetical protein
LLDSVKTNLFPKRVIIPHKSPSKTEEIDDFLADQIENEFINSDVISSEHLINEIKTELTSM